MSVRQTVGKHIMLSRDWKQVLQVCIVDL
uniref:Uncharacterized protein n=1 Tax=Arundo donax TaxID=35708 RepID=A0A0A9HAU6_ARUDO